MGPASAGGSVHGVQVQSSKDLKGLISHIYCSFSFSSSVVNFHLNMSFPLR